MEGVEKEASESERDSFMEKLAEVSLAVGLLSSIPVVQTLTGHFTQVIAPYNILSYLGGRLKIGFTWMVKRQRQRSFKAAWSHS